MENVAENKQEGAKPSTIIKKRPVPNVDSTDPCHLYRAKSAAMGLQTAKDSVYWLMGDYYAPEIFFEDLALQDAIDNLIEKILTIIERRNKNEQE